MRVSHPLKKFFLLVALIGACAAFGSAQQRMSDKDVQMTMKNLSEDAKKFRKSFDSALSKSTIRKTSQEKDGKALAQRFEKDTEGMLKQFQSTKKADTTLPVALSAADQLQKTIDSAGISSQVNADWARVQASLDKLSAAFNVPRPSARM